MRKILIVFISLLITFNLYAQSTQKKKEITVFIRVDDLFMLESKIIPQEIDEFLKIAEKHDGHVVLATIPNRLLQKTNNGGTMTDQLRDYVKRGHQIFQHGFNHKCPFTGDTGLEFFQSKITNGYTQEQRIEKIRAGKQILEGVIGKKISGYVGPGNDGLYIKQDVEKLAELGFTWLPDFETSSPVIRNNLGYYIPGTDYGWALKDENYKEMMDKSKKDFLETIIYSDCWVLKFHDHFTRKAYTNGITLKWLDEHLTWLESQENVKIKILTYDEYYKKYYPEFSSDF